VSDARFRDQTVAVTGASRGLGRDLALAFARAGAHVVVGYCQHADEAEETAARAREAGGDATVLAVDVRDPASVEIFFAGLRERRPRLDVLVNNAAVAREGPFPLLEDEAWEEVLATNLLGAARCARAAAKLMWRQKRGAIVNVASVSAFVASPGLTAYAASKGGMVAFTRNLAAELAPRGIRVNAVVPGLLSTGMAARQDPRWVTERLPRVPLGRLGEGDEVARAVLFLASEEASYVVGHALVVDGGLSL